MLSHVELTLLLELDPLPELLDVGSGSGACGPSGSESEIDRCDLCGQLVPLGAGSGNDSH